MTTHYSKTVSIAREYYNSRDADTFYTEIWGGEDIHIGIYMTAEESIFDASRRTVARMMRSLQNITSGCNVLDIGSGYGGPARVIAKTYGCQVTALNLSEVENERHRLLNQEQGLTDVITVVDGNFEDIPYPDNSFDVIWSQDAILHSGHREQVVAEVARVLKPGGQFVFTDPMEMDDCPENVLQPILDRIHLETLGSPEYYRAAAQRYGLAEVGFENLTAHLITHYSRILEETAQREKVLLSKVSSEYLENMKKGLRYWIDGGKQDYLVWGIFHFRKNSALN
jgi:sarcosine/dimethylglycine N-methyltransferase